MRFFRNWLLEELKVSERLQRICIWYIISLLIITQSTLWNMLHKTRGLSRSLNVAKTSISGKGEAPQRKPILLLMEIEKILELFM